MCDSKTVYRDIQQLTEGPDAENRKNDAKYMEMLEEYVK